MTKTVVIKGHVVGPRTVELAEPVPDNTLEVEVVASVSEDANGRVNGRSRELAWRHSHRDELQALAGQWVVLEGELIVAHGDDPALLVETARSNGIVVPYVFFVDPQHDVVKIGL
jgi:hypothetical protein